MEIESLIQSFPIKSGGELFFSRSVTIDDKKQLTKQQKKLVSKKFPGDTRNRQRLLQHIRGRGAVKEIVDRHFPGHWILSGAEINIPDNVEPSDVVMASISHSDEISVAVVAKGLKGVGVDSELISRTDDLRDISATLPIDITTSRNLMERWVVKESTIKSSKHVASFDPSFYRWSGNEISLDCGNMTMNFIVSVWSDSMRMYSLSVRVD